MKSGLLYPDFSRASSGLHPTRKFFTPNQFPQDEPKVVSEDQVTAQKAFIERGLASLAAAKLSGEYISAEDVLNELDEMLARAKEKKAQ